MKIFAFALLLLTSACSAFATDFDLGPQGRLSMAVPDRWAVRSRPVFNVGMDFTLHPRSNANAECKITVMYPPKKHIPDQKKVREDLLKLSGRFVADSVEKRADIHDYKLKQGVGSYCTFTDSKLVGKPPATGDYKTITSGFLMLSEGVVAAVTILCDDIEGEDYKAMKAIVESMEHSETNRRTI